MKKRTSAIVSLIIFVVAVVAQAVFIASIGRPREVVVYLETAIVQL